MAGILTKEDFLVDRGIITSFHLSAPNRDDPRKSQIVPFTSSFPTAFAEYDGSCIKADWISFSYFLFFYCLDFVVLVLNNLEHPEIIIDT